PSHVGGDAFVEGDINAQNNTLTIDGDLHVPAGKQTNGVTVHGKVVKEPVEVKTPCDCSNPIDVAAIVQGFSKANDNAAQGIEPDQLMNVNAETILDLPCGVYYFDAIDTHHSLTINLSGRTVI